MDDHKLLKALTEGFSTQAKISNQYWLLLMLTSVISITNISHAIDNTSIDLPFELGKVNFKDFNSFVLLLICTTSIAFGSAFLQAQRTRLLIQKVIDNTPADKKYVENIHIQDIFDSIVTPTFNRVAPIAQFLQGRHQFFGEHSPKKFIKTIGFIVYLILKIVSLTIIFIIPLIALYKNFTLFYNSNIDTSWGLPYFFYWFICIVSICVFAIMIISDFKHVVKVFFRIISNKK